MILSFFATTLKLSLSCASVIGNVVGSTNASVPTIQNLSWVCEHSVRIQRKDES